MKEFHELTGKTIASIRNSGDIEFTLTDGTECRLYHEQDCCERVEIESINGRLEDLIGRPLVLASETSPDLPYPDREWAPESYTWTVYTLATAGYRVVIRWFGESNGYYSEDVRFVAEKR